MRTFVFVTTLCNGVSALMILIGLVSTTTVGDRISKAVQLTAALGFGIWGLLLLLGGK